MRMPLVELRQARKLPVLLSAMLVAGLPGPAADAHASGLNLKARNRVQLSFNVQLGFLSVTGRTSQGRAAVSLDPTDPSRHPSGTLDMEVDTLETGSPILDTALRASLDTNRYPTARLVLRGLTMPRLKARVPTPGTLHGDFTFHGVTRSIVAPVSLSYRPEEGIEATTRFTIKPADYEIRPVNKPPGITPPDELDVCLSGTLPFRESPPEK